MLMYVLTHTHTYTHTARLATLYNCDTIKKSVDDSIYTDLLGVRHSREGINGCYLRNAKFFKRIEHFGIR